MPRATDTRYLHERTAEYRRRVEALDHPATVAQRLGRAKHFDALADSD
jgi:hypothetical protein